jgi:serine/threonine-protein kinase HipA
MMTLLGLEDNENADYSEIAESLYDVSVSVKEDLSELFRRIIFLVYVNSTDDHLRNHGLLRVGSGWRLSPIFDVNPNPDNAAIRVTSIFGETKKEPALAALQANASTFDLSSGEANRIASEVITALGTIRKYAAQAGINKAEKETMLRAIDIADRV